MKWIGALDVTSTEGSQVFVVSADTEEEAVQKIEAGEGEFEDEQIEVMSLGRVLWIQPYEPEEPEPEPEPADLPYDAPEWLLGVTHCVRYSPNCPSPFEVRLVGKGAGRLDLDLDKRATRDRIGYGKTLSEAAEDARG